MSKVTYYGNERIEAEAVDSSLFNHLKSTWIISNLGENQCKIEFSVDFEFKSYIYAYAANIFFISVSKEMFNAFLKRARIVAQQRAEEAAKASL